MEALRERERERERERNLVGTFANDRTRTASAAKALSFAARRLAIILNRIRDPRRSRSRRGGGVPVFATWKRCHREIAILTRRRCRHSAEMRCFSRQRTPRVSEGSGSARGEGGGGQGKGVGVRAEIRVLRKLAIFTQQKSGTT